MNTQDSVELRLSLPEQYRPQAAELYYEAFHQKLNAILQTKAHSAAILKQAFDPDRAIVALVDNQLGGIAGLQYGGRHFVHLAAASFRDEFGWFGGLWRFAIFKLIDRRPRPGELLMDGLAVQPTLRGLGLGTRLLNAVCDFAQLHGFSTVRLDVVDTNANARRLYERLGFVPTKTQRVPYLRNLAGFSAWTTMIKHVGL